MNNPLPLNFESDHWDWLVDHEAQLVDHGTHDVDLDSVLNFIPANTTTTDLEDLAMSNQTFIPQAFATFASTRTTKADTLRSSRTCLTKR